MTRAVALADQLDVVARAVARLEHERRAAVASNDQAALARLNLDLDQMRAARTTLAWLAKDRDGCVKLLTTRWGGGE